MFHTSFRIVDAFPMGFAAEIMLDCFKTMIFIDIINHPTELIHIFALISSIVCNDVEMFVLRLRRNKLGILSIIKVSDSERGTDTLVTVQKVLFNCKFTQ